MKKKNGFTLIELLVVIALMLSILGIAIVSFINISNNKKKESWEDVKAQIETAATEYFTANEYLFEGLADGGIGNISVGKLVSEDYLNKVTDPTTGKSVDECMEVKVEKNGSKYNATYTGNSIGRNADGTCINKYLVETSEPGAPSGTITYKKEDDTIASPEGNWFNINSLGGENKKLKVCINSRTNGNGAITTAKIGNFEVTNTGSEYCSTITNDGKYSDVIISLENTSGKKWQVYQDINKDTKKPSGTLLIVKRDSWESKNVKLNFTGDDTDNGNVIGSGIKTGKIGSTNYFNGTVGAPTWTRNNYNYTFSDVKKYTGATKSLTLKITDVAGNVSDDIKQTYKLYTSCQSGNTKYSGNWYDTGTRQSCTANGGTLKVAQERKQVDKNSGEACANAKQDASYSVASCCSKTEEYGNITWENNGKWSSTCNSSDKRTRTGTINLRSAYDHRTSCGTAAKSDSKNCDLIPSISKIQFRYNPDKCPKGWVEIRYKDINMAKYTTSFKYSHSSQGTTATTITDESSSYNETFCRGYGSVSKNIMSYTVTIYNKTSKEKRTYSGECKYSKMFTNGSHNSSWHDCD